MPAQVVGLDTGASQNDRPSTLGRGRARSWRWPPRSPSPPGGAARRPARSPRLVALSILAAIWSVARVIGPIEDYLVLWVAVDRRRGVDHPRRRAASRPVRDAPVLRPKLAVMLVPVVLLAARQRLERVAGRRARATRHRRGRRSSSRAIRPRLQPPAAGPVYVRISGTGAWALAAGVMDDLERHGYRHRWSSPTRGGCSASAGSDRRRRPWRRRSRSPTPRRRGPNAGGPDRTRTRRVRHLGVPAPLTAVRRHGASRARATRSVPNAVRIARYSSPVAAMTAE